MMVSRSAPSCEYEKLGRLMDASRLAQHGGRFDIAMTICQVLRNGDVFDSQSHKSKFRPFCDFFEAQIRRSWDCGYETRTFFAAQAGMAILCWSLSDISKHFSNSGALLEDEASVLAMLVETCTECERVMKDEAPSTFASADRENGQGLLLIRGSDDHGEKTLLSKSASNSNHTASSTQAKLLDIRNSIVWSQHFFTIDPFDSLPSSAQRLDERLKSLWSEVKKSLHPPFSYDDMTNKLDRKFKQDRVFRSLKCVIIMGHAVFGLLKSLVRLLDESDGSIESKRLSVSDQAAWTLLDGVIYQTLKDLRRCVAGVDLLEQVLAPLFATSIASAVFLRSYATAQRRLEECLTGLHRNHNNESPSAHRMSMLKFSELLWSQMVQLRMTLPRQPVSWISFPKSPSNRENQRVPWESSRSVKDENKALGDKLHSLEISLHNVSLWGDWIPLALTSEYRIGMQPELDLFFLSQEKNSSRTSDANAALCWKLDFLDKLSFDSRGILGRRFPPPVPLSPLPLLLLHIGHHLIKLDLSNSKLGCLPRSFGMYFPNLEILDLSFNHLTNLPDSFQHSTYHMKHLKIFRAHHNFFESLPNDMFSTMEGVFSSHSPPVCMPQPPLRIVDLSHNRLSSLPPSITRLHHIEELFLDHNALLAMTVVDLSRLVTTLPSLRVLTFQPQHAGLID
jgi:hypothetical protein